MIRKRYADCRYGQIHIRENAAVDGPPLVCLHATAYSSRSFDALLRSFDGERHLIAVDAPGYGESDAPPGVVGIAGYAEAIADVLPPRFDLFGYHTGVSIATEIAIAAPERVGRMTFMGVPYFQALDFAAWRDRLAARHELSESLGQFVERWDFLVTNRPPGLSLRRAFENFVDELKAWPNGWWAHQALFAHDLAARLPLITQPVAVLNPRGHLAEPSRVAAELIPHAQVIELPKLSGAILETHPGTIARLLREPKTQRISASAAG